MNAQATKLQAAENYLKELMADVTRAMEKAQEAVANNGDRIHLALERVLSFCSAREPLANRNLLTHPS